jgi:hypothetical protein
MPRKPKPVDALELAARRLAGWSGCGQSWFADVRECRADASGNSDERGVMVGNCGLSLATRGRIEEQAGTKTSQPVKRLHRWSRATNHIGIPSHRPSREIPGAMSFAKLPGPLAPLLLLYACEDLRLWPAVERYALACYPNPEAVGDAMRRIRWGARGRFAPMPADERARQLRIRADTFRKRTRRAEAMLREWLDRAAWALLTALGDDANDVCLGAKSNLPLCRRKLD